MRISLIAAVSRNGVIGRDGKLPWHLPEDLKRFKATTLGHPIVMGRKTYESFAPPVGRPLPGRTNIVISRGPRPASLPAEVLWVPSWEAAVETGKNAPGSNELFVIGGGEIYAMTLPHADRIYLTEVDLVVEGDARFPEWERGAFREVSRDERSEPMPHAYCVWERV